MSAGLDKFVHIATPKFQKAIELVSLFHHISESKMELPN